jgi:hypothetical protein
MLLYLGWSVNNYDSDGDWVPAESEEDSGLNSDSDLSELEGELLLDSLKAQMEQEVEALSCPTPYAQISKKISPKEWKNAEANCGLGYTGNAPRTLR